MAKLVLRTFPDETDLLIKEGSEIKVGGAPGAFDKEFRFMEDKLEEVRRILAGTNVTEADLDDLRDRLNTARYHYSSTTYNGCLLFSIEMVWNPVCKIFK